MKLTLEDKIEICKKFYSGEKSKSELAKSFNVSHTAISKILNDEKVSKSFKNLENDQIETSTLSMLAYLDSKRGFAQEMIGEALSSVKSKLAKASLKDTITAIKALSEIFKDNENRGESNEGIDVQVIVRDCSKEEGIDEDDE